LISTSAFGCGSFGEFAVWWENPFNRKGEIVQRSLYIKATLVVLALAALAAQLGNIVWGT
jgi:hypothetical protein